MVNMTKHDLRPHQTAAIKRILDAFKGGYKSVFVVQPTSAGKTATFVNLILKMGGKALIITSNDILVRDAKHEILKWHPRYANSKAVKKYLKDCAEHGRSSKRQEPTFGIGLVQGNKHQVNENIVIATIQSLSNDERLASMPKDFTVIIIDECHHAVAPSYLKVLNYFADNLKVGFTATPDRLDNVSLGLVFERMVYGNQPGDINLLQMWDAGFAVEPVGKEIKLDLSDLSKVTVNGENDFDEEELSDCIMDTANWDEHIIHAWKEYGESRLTVGFVPTIRMAEAAAEAMNKAHIPATVVHGKMTHNERKRRLADFKNGKYKVLWSVAVLIEGVNIPEIECVLMCRPTRSIRIYQQIIGRAMRACQSFDKKDCLVFDLVDVSREHDLLTLPKFIAKIKEVEARRQLEFEQQWEEAESEAEAQDAATIEAEGLPSDTEEELLTKTSRPRSEKELPHVEADLIVRDVELLPSWKHRNSVLTRPTFEQIRELEKRGIPTGHIQTRQEADEYLNRKKNKTARPLFA